MNTCPCCSAQLLRHARHNSIYWFCPRCRQEMPVLELDSINFYKYQKSQVVKSRTPVLSQPVGLRAK
ncbi:MAG TPA: hypothetical protein DCP31_41395 [Cyanobacteria bacterium UBA8543]|nr:hypothetical protein [Cyanobacteria bacterium UBA8543]